MAAKGIHKFIMSNLSKVLVTIGVVFIFIIFFGGIAGAASANGHTPGILGLILLAALIGALRAIWKKPKDNGNKNDNSSILQK